MKAPALLILLLFPSLALAQQQYYGTKAASVETPPPADPADAAKLTIHPGDIITPDNIRSSIQALYDTGHYRTIEVDAMAGADGTDVSFVVTPQYYFSTFRLEPEYLLDRPISSYFQLPLGKKFSTSPMAQIASETEKLVEEAGYFNVTIVPKYTSDEHRLMTVIFKADAGKERAKIRSIQFVGGQQILSEKEFHNALKVNEGDDFNADKLDKGLARIRQAFVDKGYLTAKTRYDRTYDPVTNRVDLNIEVEPRKTTVIQVSEEGGGKSEISKEKLRTLVPIYEEGTVDSDLVGEGGQHIVEYYQQQGYFEAAVTPNQKDTADQSVEVDYEVTKGERHRVRSIRIEGTAFFTEAEILKKMKTRVAKSTSSGLFSPDLLAKDIQVIKAMYLNAGFLSSNIESDKPDSPDHNIDITVTIHEGLRSTLEEITFSGNQTFPEPELWRTSGIQADQVYSAAIIDNARDALAAFYYSKGFSEVRIDSHIDPDLVNDTVNVRFDITEGTQFRIGLILVAGNTLTAEKVITRTSELNQNGHQDFYNPEAVLEAQQKLYALGIFNRVEIVALDQDVGPFKILLIQVEETKPILLTPGFGVTDRDGPRATIELSNNNLFGLARTFIARVRGAQHERQFQASYRDPRLLNHDLLGIASTTFDKTTHLDSKGNLLFRSNEVDLSLQVVRKLSKKKNRTLSFSASYQTVNLQDIRVNPNIRRFPDATGIIQIARLGTSFIGDHRDSISDPTRGKFLTGSFEIANKYLGSEVNFASIFTQGTYYVPVRGGVIASSARIGLKKPYGGDLELPISERFFAGGSTTLRGFKFDEAGPPGGGQLLTIGNIEYRVPLNFLPLKGLGTALFYDTGTVFERPSDFTLDQFTHTAGTGLRYKTPIGPVRVDVGFNLRPKPTDRKYCLFFTLGHAF